MPDTISTESIFYSRRDAKTSTAAFREHAPLETSLKFEPLKIGNSPANGTPLQKMTDGVQSPSASSDDDENESAYEQQQKVRLQGIDCVVISDEVRNMIMDVDVKSAVLYLRQGAYLQKYCRTALKKPHQRLFIVDMDSLVLKWYSPKKHLSKTQLYFTDIDLIVPGIDSDFWRKKSEQERQLGIELLMGSRKLRLECASLPSWKIWFRGLLYAHQKAVTKRKRAESLTHDFIKQQWELADLDHNGSIQFNELIHLLQRLKCCADLRYAEQLFDKVVEDGSLTLEYDEFKLLIHCLLTHHDIMEFFEPYKDAKSGLMSEEGFTAFLQDVQHAPSNEIEAALETVRNLGEPFRQKGALTDLGFNYLITSEANSLFNPKKAVVYQDMDYPLHDYWIASSHNTYLTGDQVVGRSAVARYIDVLLRGCRCVELDCWDGTDGEPVIYHGHTLTSKISFRDVVKACNDYGFQKSSHPIILSLEMHCSASQKARIGQILNDLLGDKIHRLEKNGPPPSLSSLQGKFLIKGRVVDEKGEEIVEGNEDDLLMEEQHMAIELAAEFPESYCAKLSFDPPFIPDFVQESKSPNSTRAGSATRNMISGELKAYYHCISLPGKQLEGFKDPSRHSMHVCSLTEKKFMKVLKNEPQDLIGFHRKYLSRVYPVGTRLMSSNYNPMPCWIAGSQMVALNYQMLSTAMLLNLGRFLENGNCGYVLKPQFLRQGLVFDPLNLTGQQVRQIGEVPIGLNIKVLAAQQLPRPSSDSYENNFRDLGRKKQSTCPYVVVSLQGVPQDSVSYKTHFIANNGLNPRWKKQTFSFEVTLPSISILLFEVRHHDVVRSEFLAAAAIPVNCIQPGLRWVSLYDADFRPVIWSGLLVQVTLRSQKANIAPTASMRTPEPFAQPRTSQIMSHERRTRLLKAKGPQPPSELQSITLL